MNTIQQTCSFCGGTGTVKLYKPTANKDTNGYRIAIAQVEECSSCGGKGYVEYAVFTVEEAQAILKHCGITTGEIGDI